MSKRIRKIVEPFVVTPPSGARVRTRLKVSDEDAVVLMALGTYLGSLASKDVAERSRQGKLDAKETAISRRERKRALTAKSSSRWAGTITRTSEDAFQTALRNLEAECRSLRSRITCIRQRLAIPVGERRGRLRGYATRDERFQKQRRLQVLERRLVEVETRIEAGRVSVCRAGKALAKVHHHLDEAGLTEEQWRERWQAKRLFLTADGEKDQLWGNLTIRWHPYEHWLELALPTVLSHLANRGTNRYRLSCPVEFSYRGDEVTAQATNGAIRYDIIFDPEKQRWYLDASWKIPTPELPIIDQLRGERCLAADLNGGHIASIVVDGSGNPVGRPTTIQIELAELPATTRKGHLCQAISTLIDTAKANGCRIIVIEDLDFADARELGKERNGNCPSRGKRGKYFRAVISGIPTAQFRKLLVQMAANAGIIVIAVDPGYTSKWGAEHWLRTLQAISPDASGHHAAALVIGRRGLGQRARQRTRCDLIPAEHGGKRATRSVVRSKGVGQPALLSEQRMRETGTREARGHPHLRQKTQRAERSFPVDQVAQDRSEPPTRWDLVPLSV